MFDDIPVHAVSRSKDLSNLNCLELTDQQTSMRQFTTFRHYIIPETQKCNRNHLEYLPRPRILGRLSIGFHFLGPFWGLEALFGYLSHWIIVWCKENKTSTIVCQLLIGGFNPSGKRLHKTRERSTSSPFYSWENPLFLSPFSIAMLVMFTRG